MNKPVGAGVSSACFFPLETADSVKILSEWHIPNIEIFFNSFQELKDGYLERLSALCREAGTKVVSIHPFTSNSESLYFFTSYPGRLQDGLMIYRPFLRAAQKLGATVLVFHGATLQNRMDIPQSAANLRVLDRVARRSMGSQSPMKMWSAAEARIRTTLYSCGNITPSCALCWTLSRRCAPGITRWNMLRNWGTASSMSTSATAARSRIACRWDRGRWIPWPFCSI